MTLKKISFAVIATALLALAGLPAFAGGAGGVIRGEQYINPELGNFTSADLGTRYNGGFGYGVSHDGRRFGGFGLAFYSEPYGTLLSGGVGGTITGQEFRVGPFELATNLWTGIGGVGKDAWLGRPEGYLVFFGQLDVEAGITILPWWQISTYAGMQIITNLAPGKPFEGLLFYTPVVGVRVAWGAF